MAGAQTDWNRVVRAAGDAAVHAAETKKKHQGFWSYQTWTTPPSDTEGYSNLDALALTSLVDLVWYVCVHAPDVNNCNTLQLFADVFSNGDAQHAHEWINNLDQLTATSALRKLVVAETDSSSTEPARGRASTFKVLTLVITCVSLDLGHSFDAEFRDKLDWLVKKTPITKRLTKPLDKDRRLCLFDEVQRKLRENEALCDVRPEFAYVTGTSVRIGIDHSNGAPVMFVPCSSHTEHSTRHASSSIKRYNNRRNQDMVGDRAGDGGSSTGTWTDEYHELFLDCITSAQTADEAGHMGEGKTTSGGVDDHATEQSAPADPGDANDALTDEGGTGRARPVPHISVLKEALDGIATNEQDGGRQAGGGGASKDCDDRIGRDDGGQTSGVGADKHGDDRATGRDGLLEYTSAPTTLAFDPVVAVVDFVRKGIADEANQYSAVLVDQHAGADLTDSTKCPCHTTSPPSNGKNAGNVGAHTAYTLRLNEHEPKRSETAPSADKVFVQGDGNIVTTYDSLWITKTSQAGNRGVETALSRDSPAGCTVFEAWKSARSVSGRPPVGPALASRCMHILNDGGGTRGVGIRIKQTPGAVFGDCLARVEGTTRFKIYRGHCVALDLLTWHPATNTEPCAVSAWGWAYPPSGEEWEECGLCPFRLDRVPDGSRTKFWTLYGWFVQEDLQLRTPAPPRLYRLRPARKVAALAERFCKETFGEGRGEGQNLVGERPREKKKRRTESEGTRCRRVETLSARATSAG